MKITSFALILLAVLACKEPKGRDQMTAPYRMVLIRKGDTLTKIAQRELGDSTRWREIVSLNSGATPADLAPGRQIKIPIGPKGTGAR